MAVANTFPWHGLPLELQRRIMVQSLLAKFCNTAGFRLTPREPVPDIAFSNVPNQQVRQQFDKVILPDTVMVEIECRTCATCHFDADKAAARHCCAIDTDLPATWAYLRERMSTVKIVVRCDAPIFHIHKAQTLYVSGNRLNILRFILTFLGPMRWNQPPPLPLMFLPHHRDKMINVSCHPKSYVGAEQTAELLNLFADLLHGLRTTRKSIKQVVPPALKSVLRPAIQRPYPTHTSWEAARFNHRNLLREFQTLLNMSTFHPHHLVECAAFAFEDFDSSNHPVTSAAVPQIPQGMMEEFTQREITINCLMFVAFHGLSDYMLKRRNDPHVVIPNQYRVDIVRARRRLSSQRHNLVRRRWTVWNNLSVQRAAQFRNWRLRDAPFLVHHAAMLQTYLRAEIIILVQDWFIGGPSRVRLLQHYSTDIAGIAQAWNSHLRPLRLLDRYITVIRANTPATGDHSLYEGYDTYQIPAFIAGMQQLLAGLSVNTWNMTDDQFFATLDLGFFYLPRRLRIPTIAPADWASVRRTFDDVNNVSLWHV